MIDVGETNEFFKVLLDGFNEKLVCSSPSLIPLDLSFMYGYWLVLSMNLCYFGWCLCHCVYK